MCEWTKRVDISGEENTLIPCIALRAHSWEHFKQSESGRIYFHRFFPLTQKKGVGGTTLNLHHIAGDT